jgi:hypothetical protein
MPIRSVSDAFYTAIAWLPILAFIIALGVVMTTGLVHLETRSEGTEYFVDNDASIDYYNPQDIKEDREIRREIGLD